VSQTHTPSPIVSDLQPKSYKAKRKRRNCKCLENCLKQRCHFTPLVIYMDGLLGREAATFSKCLAARLASTWQRSYLSITIVRATHLSAGESSPHRKNKHPTRLMGRWCQFRLILNTTKQIRATLATRTLSNETWQTDRRFLTRPLTAPNTRMR
jgi:hypothetical protein